jgi:phenylalanyl-tRNA synthetase alpha chain
MKPVLNPEAVKQALQIRDLTNPDQGRHAMQLILNDIIDALQIKWSCKTLIYRESPIVTIADNYDRLKYPAAGAAREARYTRYISENTLLRTQTSAMIPRAMQSVSSNLPDDLMIICPGLVYRRDCIDKLHTGEPHQVDIWRVCCTKKCTSIDLQEMVATIVTTALPGMQWRTEPRVHPYTQKGLQIDVNCNDSWVEIGEGGLAHPTILAENMLNHQGLTGLACGLGLDRILMLRKGINDIRLLRSQDPRVLAQINDLSPYKPVSCMPPVTRDLSIVLAEDETVEDLGDKVREALGEQATIVEHVDILSETLYQNLPEPAIQRLGIQQGQKNILLRVILRDLEKTLTKEECNKYRDIIYGALHQGIAWDWTSK